MLLKKAFLFVFLPAAIWAQPSVTIFGSAKDSSGAVVPGATVQVTDTQTGTIRKAASDAAGEWIVPQLVVGTYSVRAEAPGFKAFVANGITVQVNENRRVDVTFEIGALTDSISVSGELAQVETREGTLKEVIDSKRIEELPLNGRNPLQLQYLVAGVGVHQPGGGGQAENQAVAINGSRSNSNNYTLDGADNSDPFFNTASVFPSPDALQEFSIQTSSYGADKGGNAGASMVAVTKSGTNQFHGTLFEFLRNEKLNARNFFAIGVPPFKRNQYGGVLGGPVRRDKTFFFFSYQGTRERSAPSSVTATVLTPAQRSGDFSNLKIQLKDPDGGVFPGNKIPVSRLYGPSLKFLDRFVPLPNYGASLFTYASQQSINDDQIVAKADHHLSANHSLSGRMLYSTNTTNQATGNIPGFYPVIKYDNWNVTGTDTWVFGPNVVNTFTLAWNNIDRRQLSVVPGNTTWTDLGSGLVRSFTQDFPAGMDTLLDGYFEAFSRFPLSQFREIWEFADLLSISRGAHLIKMGGDIHRTALDRPETFRGDAYLRFRNTFTGDAAADFVLGRPTQIIQNSPSLVQPRGGEWAAFVQDDWRVTPRLTLNLGIRWDPFLPYYDLLDRRPQIRIGEKSVRFPMAPVGLVYAGDPGVSRTTLQRRWLNLAPRFGFAWDPWGNGKFSVRGGYGIFHDSFRLQGFGSTGPAYSRSLTITNPPGGLADPYRTTGNPWPFQPPETAQQRNSLLFDPLTAVGFFDPDFRNSYTEQWNLNVQRQLHGSYVLTLAYVGSAGKHLYMQNQINPGIYDGSNRALDQRRPLAPAFGALTADLSTAASSYHALQATLNKRFSRGLTILANYTWAKTIDNVSADGNSPADPFNINLDRGHSDFDLTHRFVASFIWQMPTPFRSRLLKGVFGGWEVNGIVTLESGRWFTVTSGKDNSGTGVNSDRADLIGDPAVHGNRSRGAAIQQWFNTAAFGQNAPGTFGTAGRNILRGPGFAGVDLGLVKNIRIAERHSLVIRGESFNALNRVNLANPNANQSSNNFGQITSAGDPRVFQVAAKYVF